MIDGVLAKHGYTVDWGFFNGVCSGAEDKPLEHDKTHTEAIIRQLREVHAAVLDQRASDLKSGAIEPTFYKRVRNEKSTSFRDREIDIEVKRVELSDYEAQQQIARAVYRAERDAQQARSHAAMLEKLIETRFGQALYPVSDRKVLAVGDRVLIGGKKGWIGEVIEMKYKEQRRCFSMRPNYPTMHAVVRREKDGFTIAVPTSTIRQSAIVTGGAL
jgi:hypothetical protein